MPKNFRIVFYLAILLLIQGCSMCRVGCRTCNVKDERDTLMELDRSLGKMSVEQGARTAFEVLLAEDAIELSQGQDPVFGRDKICQGIAELDAKNITLDWEPVDGKVSMCADMGWTWGTYTISWEEDGEVKSTHGKYVTVWEKDQEGNWKAKIDIGNSSPKK